MATLTSHLETTLSSAYLETTLTSSHLETTLPAELNTPEFLPKIKKGVMQWSRIVAWSWTDYLAFAGQPEEAQERKLKTLLIQVLK